MVRSHKMMDELKFDYVTLELPNIVAEFKKTNERKPLRTYSKIYPLIEALALKKPQWKFIAHRYHSGDNSHLGYAFRVCEGRDVLGEIVMSYGRRDDDAFEIRNKRIQDSRERGGSAKTKDMKKAMKLVLKSFGAKTLTEQVGEATKETLDVIWRVTSDRTSQFRAIYGHMEKYLSTHIMDNHEAYASIALRDGADPKVLELLGQVYEEHQITKEIEECRANNTGVVVLTLGSDYAVTYTDPNTLAQQTLVHTTDTLPVHIKRSVGLLKLVEVKHFLKGVGVRIADSTFFVIAKAEDE